MPYLQNSNFSISVRAKVKNIVDKEFIWAFIIPENAQNNLLRKCLRDKKYDISFLAFVDTYICP